MSFNHHELEGFHLGRHSLVLWVLVLGVVATGFWAHRYRIDEVTRATGSVIASSRVQVIQSVDGGVLEQLTVKEGDRVKAGDTLATLKQTRFAASVNEFDARIAALKAQALRLRAESVGQKELTPRQFPAEVRALPELVTVQIELFNQRQRGLNEELRTLQVAADLAAEDAKLVKQLGAGGDVSRSEIIRVERAVNEAQAQINNRKNKFLQEVRVELAKSEEELAQALEGRVQKAVQLEDTVFRALVPGIVKNVRVTTLGGVLRAGEELMQIVPLDDELIVEAKVLPTDIAWVKPGINAHIRFDAFDYTIFGAVRGRVSYVSADTLKEETRQGEVAYYRVHIVTAGNPVMSITGRPLDILPGMTAQVDIRTGDRTVLDYLLKPLRKTVGEAFGER